MIATSGPAGPRSAAEGRRGDVIATAPGKLILAGEYAVLDGAPALVVAVDRRVVARRLGGPRGTAPLLVTLADVLAERLGPDHAATRAAFEIAVDSSAMFAGEHKLGLGSSAAVTVAATALALAAEHSGPDAIPVIDRALVAEIAHEAHGRVQARRGATGSGTDIAAAVHGGVIEFRNRLLDRLSWPAGVTLLPFFTGASADTPSLVARVAEARAVHPVEVGAALTSIAETARAACQACRARSPAMAATGLISALGLAATAFDRLAQVTGIALVPPCVTRARAALQPLGGTAKTTGAGGGDVAIAVIPATEDATRARRLLIEVGCQPLELKVDHAGVDLGPDVQ
ncbi:MAG TPA: hypothetical protein VLX92_09685 [Kofleriaceae bacterium]|nr:hypothetical protein [Kofleriaceae bacterium]